MELSDKDESIPPGLLFDFINELLSYRLLKKNVILDCTFL